MALYVTFFTRRVVRADKINHFFHKQKFEIVFLELYIHRKLCIILFESMS